MLAAKMLAAEQVHQGGHLWELDGDRSFRNPREVIDFAVNAINARIRRGRGSRTPFEAYTGHPMPEPDLIEDLMLNGPPDRRTGAEREAERVLWENQARAAAQERHLEDKAYHDAARIPRQLKLRVGNRVLRVYGAGATKLVRKGQLNEGPYTVTGVEESGIVVYDCRPGKEICPADKYNVARWTTRRLRRYVRRTVRAGTGA